MSKQPGCVRQPGHEGECYVGTKVFDCGDLETHRLARIGLCFDGVSADDVDAGIAILDNASTYLWQRDQIKSARKLSKALASLLRESEKGGGT